MADANARRAPFVALILAGCSFAGCSTDTGGLARSAPLAPPAGGAGSSAPVPSGGGQETGSGSLGDAAPSPGQSGLGALEVVHGLVDGGQLFVCLWDLESGEVLAADVPQPLGGVSYGQSTSVPSSWDLSRSIDVELFVAAGEAAAEPSCSGLRDVAVDGELSRPAGEAGDAGLALPPFPLEPLVARRAGSLRLSPGVIQPGAHYALVAAGCTSPAGSPSDAICGPPDSVFSSQQTIVLAEIAAEVAGAGAGLQFLNASRAVERADVVLQGQSQRQSLRLTSNVQFGAVRPRNAAPVEEPAGVELHVQGASQSSYTQPWSDTLAAIGRDSLASGQNYLLVYVGPAPGSFSEGVSPPRFVLLRGD